MTVMARDRLTNVRGDRLVADPCSTCHGGGALLPLPSGTVVCARFVVPNRRAWRRLPVAPCPVCGGTGYEPHRRPSNWGEG